MHSTKGAHKSNVADIKRGINEDKVPSRQNLKNWHNLPSISPEWTWLRIQRMQILKVSDYSLSTDKNHNVISIDLT